MHLSDDEPKRPLAAEKNLDPIGQPDGTVFKAPVIEVRNETAGQKRFSSLFYNRINLGRQYQRSKEHPDLPRLPTTYYHDKSPIGIILGDPKSFPEKKSPPVAVLGMNLGTLAAYAKPGQILHFTEREPTFVKLSLPDKGGKPYFTFVQDAIDRGARVNVFEGEPREMIEKHGKGSFYKVIVVESYKMPRAEVRKELMTKKALSMLMGKVREDGIVAFHTSNRYYNLPPIIASAANELKFAYIVGDDRGNTPRSEENDFRFSSQWVMVARDKKYLAHLKNDATIRIEWHPATLMTKAGNKHGETQTIDKEFLWTDTAEQSFRGLYLLDPEIDRLNDSLRDIVEPLSRAIRAWSAASAEKLNRPKRSNSKDGAK
jgi:hypothetical protein